MILEYVSIVSITIFEIIIKKYLMGILKNNKMLSYLLCYDYIYAVKVISLILLMKTNLL